MTVIVDKKRCNGCPRLPEARCVQGCPGDLMALGADRKACIREESDCWDCMTCVKLCPRQAITTRLAYQLADYKATLVPRVRKGAIHWHLTDAQGREEDFEVQTLSQGAGS